MLPAGLERGPRLAVTGGRGQGAPLQRNRGIQLRLGMAQPAAAEGPTPSATCTRRGTVNSGSVPNRTRAPTCRLPRSHKSTSCRDAKALRRAAHGTKRTATVHGKNWPACVCPDSWRLKPHFPLTPQSSDCARGAAARVAGVGSGGPAKQRRVRSPKDAFTSA